QRFSSSSVKMTMGFFKSGLTAIPLTFISIMAKNSSKDPKIHGIPPARPHSSGRFVKAGWRGAFNSRMVISSISDNAIISPIPPPFNEGEKNGEDAVYFDFFFRSDSLKT